MTTPNNETTCIHDDGTAHGGVPCVEMGGMTPIEAQIDAALTVLYQEWEPPYSVRIRDYPETMQPGDAEWARFQDAEADAERKNRDSARRAIEAALQATPSPSDDIDESESICQDWVAFDVDNDPYLKPLRYGCELQEGHSGDHRISVDCEAGPRPGAMVTMTWPPS